MSLQLDRHDGWPWLRWRHCISLALLVCALPVPAQTDAILPPIGGGGGGQFVARCPQGQLLAGFALRTGDDVDAIQPLCVTASAPTVVGPVEPYPSRFGGNGGGEHAPLLCPADAPVVIGMYVSAEGEDTVIVNNIHLFCGVAGAVQVPSEFPSVVFDGPRYRPSDLRKAPTEAMQRCPAGLVGVGISGRSGIWLDAVGLFCGPPATTPPADQAPAIALGRVKSASKPIRFDTRIGRPAIPTRFGNTPIESTAAIHAVVPESDPAICAAARNARAHSSPAAPNLEAQCAAARARAKAPLPVAPATLPVVP